MTIPSESGLEMKLTGFLFQRAWREALQKVRVQDPRPMAIHELHIDIPNMEVTPEQWQTLLEANENPRVVPESVLNVFAKKAITSERVAPASERSGDVEQQTKEENL